MTGKRKRYSADFKAKVALEALRGELTAAQLASKHSIHQTMVGECNLVPFSVAVIISTAVAECNYEVYQPAINNMRVVQPHEVQNTRPISIFPYLSLFRSVSGLWLSACQSTSRWLWFETPR
jgi:hypothetical protein